MVASSASARGAGARAAAVAWCTARAGLAAPSSLARVFVWHSSTRHFAHVRARRGSAPWLGLVEGVEAALSAVG